MIFWSQLIIVAILSLAACKSVHNQDSTGATSPTASSPLPSPSPPSALPATLDQPVSLSLTPGDTPSPVRSTPIPIPVQHSYNSVPGVGRNIAITFDDGPSPQLTPMLLDILKQRKIKATFFVVGQNAAEYPDLLKRMVAEGHEIGNHSWSHPILTRLGMEGVESQMLKTNAAIKRAVGYDPVLMRPPYGATNAALNRRFAETYGMKVILWSVDPLDWRYRNAAHVQRAILSQIGSGGIILSHDIHATTVAAMPGTLDALLAQGYKFATVSELIAMQGRESSSPPATGSTSTIMVPRPVSSSPGTSTAKPFSVDRYEPVIEPASDGSARP